MNFVLMILGGMGVRRQHRSFNRNMALRRLWRLRLSACLARPLDLCRPTAICPRLFLQARLQE